MSDEHVTTIGKLTELVEAAYKEAYVEENGGPKFAIVPDLQNDWLASDACASLKRMGLPDGCH